MIDPKAETFNALAKAKADLDEALDSLQRLPVLDPEKVGFTAHALNNYLSVIHGTLHLLLASLRDRESVEIICWLEGLDHTTDLMRQTIGHLLNNAALQSSAKLKFGAVNLPKYVERWCAYYRKISGQKGIRIEFLAPVNVPAAKADVVAVGAVLDNLLSNAVKYSPPGRTIRVEICPGATTVECIVCDEGPGISENDQKSLFQRGVRLTAQPTGGESSSGFGLAVARELTEQMGGAIWCQSVLGKGSCFHVRWPVWDGDEQPATET